MSPQVYAHVGGGGGVSRYVIFFDIGANLREFQVILRDPEVYSVHFKQYILVKHPISEYIKQSNVSHGIEGFICYWSLFPNTL